MRVPVRWSEEKIAALESNGFGRGKGATYTPWPPVRNRQPTLYEIWGYTTGRTHRTYSATTAAILYFADWAQEVVDVREGYPLDRELTQHLAQSLDIKHPTYPGTRVPMVMTADFLLTIIRGGEEHFVALNALSYTVTAAEVELLELQRSYFALLDSPHHLVDPFHLPLQKLDNIRWLRGAKLMPGELEPYPGYYREMLERMRQELPQQQLLHPTLGVGCYAQTFDTRYSAARGTGLRLARILMAERYLRPNLAAPDILLEPLSKFAIGKPETPQGSFLNELQIGDTGAPTPPEPM